MLQPFENHFHSVSRFIKIPILFDPEMPHLGIDPKKVITKPPLQKTHMSPKMFTELFQVVKN